jgi:hypothetical protein
MVRIQCADLPAGIFAHAATRSDRKVVYLRPGLTGAQQRESLRRALQTARIGVGPPLSARELRVALAAHRLRTGLAILASAVRTRPIACLLLAGGLAGMACACLLVSVA